MADEEDKDGRTLLYFPPLMCFHDSKRELFVNYGSKQNVDIMWDENKRSVEVICQCDHWGQNRGVFTATLPSLPVTPPNTVHDPLHEPIMADIVSLNTKLNNFCSLMKSQKSCLQNSAARRRYFKDLLEKLHTNPSEVHYMRRVQISGLAKLAQHVVDADPVLANFNKLYMGGCMHHVVPSHHSSSQPGLLVYSSGSHLDNLSVSDLSVSNGHLTVATPAQQTSCPSRIYQISVCTTKQKVYCGVRLSDRVSLYEISSSQPITCFGSYVFTTETPVFISVSPYLKQECLVTTSDCNLYLWKPEHKMELVKSDLETRFVVGQSWWACQFGGHPRSAVLTDPTGVCNVNIMDGESHDIFTLPHPSLHPSELITASSTLPSARFYHVIATDYTILLVDERSPNLVLMSWSHPLQCAPLHLTPSRLSHDQWHLLVTSQHNPETLLYQFRVGNNALPQSTATVLRVSGVEDFALWALHQGETVSRTLIDQRLSVPLIASCYVPHTHSDPTSEPRTSFSVLQMSGFGDVFSQDFHHRDTADSDCTWSYGPGMPDKVVLPSQKHSVRLLADTVIQAQDSSECSTGGIDWREWIAEASHMLMEASRTKTQATLCRGGDEMLNDSQEGVNTLPVFQNKNTHFPHVLCPLCTTSTDTTDERCTDWQDEFCFACGNDLKSTFELINSVKEDVVQPARDVTMPACLSAINCKPPQTVSPPQSNTQPMSDDEAYPQHTDHTSLRSDSQVVTDSKMASKGASVDQSMRSPPNDPLSLIILKLWDENIDVKDEVEQRDKWVKVQREMLMSKDNEEDELMYSSEESEEAAEDVESRRNLSENTHPEPDLNLALTPTQPQLPRDTGTPIETPTVSQFGRSSDDFARRRGMSESSSVSNTDSLHVYSPGFGFTSQPSFLFSSSQQLFKFKSPKLSSESRKLTPKKDRKKYKMGF